MSLEYLKEQINKYIPYNEQEEMDKSLMLDFIEKNENCLTRDSRVAHFTASNWIVNKERTKVLMIYHNIYKSWAWTGGHADGDEDLFHVALKEAEEESNLKNLKPLVDGINYCQNNSHTQIDPLPLIESLQKYNRVSTKHPVRQIHCDYSVEFEFPF